jgi:hypothetical protein
LHELPPSALPSVSRFAHATLALRARFARASPSPLVSFVVSGLSLRSVVLSPSGSLEFLSVLLSYSFKSVSLRSLPSFHSAAPVGRAFLRSADANQARFSRSALKKANRLHSLGCSSFHTVAPLLVGAWCG